LAWLASLNDWFTDDWMKEQAGWKLSGQNESTFWYLQAVNKLSNGAFDYAEMDKAGMTITDQVIPGHGSGAVDRATEVYFNGVTKRKWPFGTYRTGTIAWAPHTTWDVEPTVPLWRSIDGGDTVVSLTHELQHAQDWLTHKVNSEADRQAAEMRAIARGNLVIGAIYRLTPKKYDKPLEAYMRPMRYP
jgi:hypothetical protein